MYYFCYTSCCFGSWTVMVVSYFGLFVFCSLIFLQWVLSVFLVLGFHGFVGFSPSFRFLIQFVVFWGTGFSWARLFLLNCFYYWMVYGISFLFCICGVFFFFFFLFLVEFANGDFRLWDVLLSVGNCVFLFNWSRSFMISLYVNGDFERLFSLFCFVCLLVLICWF